MTNLTGKDYSWLDHDHMTIESVQTIIADYRESSNESNDELASQPESEQPA